MKQWADSKLGKEYVKAVYCHLAYLCIFLHAEYIMQNAGLDETQAGIKITGRSINNLSYADDIALYSKKQRTKEPLDESESGE